MQLNMWGGRAEPRRFSEQTAASVVQLPLSYQSPQASTLYTKVAKSAKKELEAVRSFALFATLV
jgi:hypothetical protein